MYMSAHRVKTARRHPPAKCATTTDPAMVAGHGSQCRSAWSPVIGQSRSPDIARNNHLNLATNKSMKTLSHASSGITSSSGNWVTQSYWPRRAKRATTATPVTSQTAKPGS